MKYYSIELRNRITDCGFLSFAKNMNKNIGKKYK